MSLAQEVINLYKNETELLGIIEDGDVLPEDLDLSELTDGELKELATTNVKGQMAALVTKGVLVPKKKGGYKYKKKGTAAGKKAWDIVGGHKKAGSF